jgi:hypothetical protein
MQLITYDILYFPSLQDIVLYVVKKAKSCAPDGGQNLPETCWADLGDQ